MNKLSLTMSVLSAVGVALPLFANPASADNLSRYSNGELQPVKWPKMRPEIRVVNTAPIVKYDTPPEPTPVYLIPTGLPQAKSAPVVVLPGPGQAGGASGGIVAPPGYAIVDPNDPGPARFGSNIPAQGMAPATALPNGTTSNRLAGRMWGSPKSGAGSPVAASIPARAMPAGGAAPRTAIYQATSSGAGSGSALSTVKTSTHAVLAPSSRGSLLK